MNDNIAKIFNCLVTDVEVSPDKTMTRISIDNDHEFVGKDNNDGSLRMAMPLQSTDAKGIQEGDTATVKFIGSENFSDAAVVVEFSRKNQTITSFQLK